MITYLKNVRLVTKQHLVYKELSEIYEMIKSNPGIKMITKDLRTWIDSNKYIAGKDDELDKKFREQKSQMPAFISAGEFENAYNDGISLYYGYITIDVDKIINVHPRILINSITSEDKSIAMAFISPSGKGIKFIHCLDYRGLTTIEDIQIFHNSAFEALKKRYLDKYTINIDESGRDISRKCFISHDPEAYWNENPEKFSWGFNLEE